MEHKIKIVYGGKEELSFQQLECSCVWKSRKFYAYEDYQIALRRAAEEQHLTGETK
ncbi:hypothetical protein [Pasteurella testudinis]|uniref:hypothetical protein n=1 Tax=Pasteurella testudinis TaxID=761 RepID=UPI001356BA44|nr:hypothetical protein [Pasteurella testudinis]